MNILIISPDYPNIYRTECPFVKQLVDEFARQGHNCCVIAPYNKMHNRKDYSYEEIQAIGTKQVLVYRPKYFTVSNVKVLGRHISSILFERAVKRTLRRISFVPDAVYGHFWFSAVAGYEYAKSRNIPIIAATGESDIKMMNPDLNHSKSICQKVDGVVCVSSKNLEESIALNLTTKDKCKVFPNGIDNRLFCKQDKRNARKALGLPEDIFIVAFVGAFKESKGPDRLSKAIDMIESNDVYSLFIGGGSLEPYCKNILFKGRLLHEQIPQYLNASDVFVLPTRAEGCCNAIIEAMACGLPIISSNLPFNWDVLNENNSIMIDPNNVVELSKAICALKDNPEKRAKMKESALVTAASLTIEQRAHSIIHFIETYIQNK